MVNQDALCARLNDGFDVLSIEHGLTVKNHLISLNGNDFTGVFIHEILHPTFQDTGSQTATDSLLQVGLVHLQLFCQIENLKNVFVCFKTNGTQQSGDRKLLLSVNVAYITLLMAVANSIQEPLKGMIRAE